MSLARAIAEKLHTSRGPLRTWKDAYLCSCPSHDDNTPSFAIWDRPDLRYGVMATCFTGCSWQQIQDALLSKGLIEKEFKPQRKQSKRVGQKKKVGEWVYRDVDGEPHRKKERFDYDGGGKEFFWWTWRKREQQWVVGSTGAKPLLYALPDVLNAPDKSVVVLVEGEKKADRLRKAGILATTDGNQKWCPQFTLWLSRKIVVLIPDNDAPGHNKHVKIGVELDSRDVDVRWLNLPGCGPKLDDHGVDVYDWLETLGHDEAELKALIAGAPKWTPPITTDDPDVKKPAYVLPTQRALAQRFAEEQKTDVYFTARRDPYVWDGARYRLDHKSTECKKRAFAFIEKVYNELLSLPGIDQVKVESWIQKVDTASGYSGLLALAASHLQASIDQFDCEPYLFNAKNCVIDLRDGVAYPHDRKYMMTKISPIEYKGINTPCPKWKSALDMALGDPELIEFLQRAIGYSFTAYTHEKVFFFCHGELGDNGKTTVLETFQYIAGDYAGARSRELLLDKHFSDPKLANPIRLLGLRLILMDEITTKDKFSDQKVRASTGEDTMTGANLYEDPIEFLPVGKIWIRGNDKPILDSTTGNSPTWRRVVLIPFERQIPKEKREGDIKAKLKAEASGILSWIVEGAVLWHAAGLCVPEKVKIAVEQYKDEMDLLKLFLDECCELGEYTQVKSRKLFQVFCKWTKENNYSPFTSRRFCQAMQKHGFEHGRGTGGACRYKGVSLNEEYADE